MIYQPRNVQPSYISVDGSLDNLFTMEVNTNTFVNAYRLTILDSNNSIVYGGDKVSLTDNVYNGEQLAIPVPSTIGLVNGNDYKWKARLYQSDSNMLITKGSVQSSSSTTTNIYTQKNINIKTDMYIKIGSEKKMITSYDVETGLAIVTDAFTSAPLISTPYEILSDFLETNPEYVLYVRGIPSLSITNMPSTITKKYYEFIGSYTQNDGVPMIYYSWDLYLVTNTGSQLIKSSGKIYSADIRFYYNGFKTGQNYSIKLTIETDFGVIITTNLQNFNVEYTVLSYLQKPSAHLLSSQGAIQVDWMVPTSFAPSTINLDSVSGLIQPGDNSTTLLYLEKGAQILPNSMIMISGYDTAVVQLYNAYTGVAALSTPLTVIPSAGDSYQIVTTQNQQMVGVNILSDTPYTKTNSAQLGSYALLYKNPDGVSGMGNMPSDYRLTMQFLPNYNFFYGTTNVYNDMIAIADLYTTDELGAGEIGIFAHKYKIVSTTPSLNEVGAVALTTVATPPTGEANTVDHIYLYDDINLTVQQYITFPVYGYIESILEYDSVTKKLTFGKSLPFVPVAGDYIYMNDTVSANFYDSVNNVFTLQPTSVPSINNDYVWLDNSTWDDTQFWVEGGTEIERIANTWWKIDANKNEITIGKGGV